MSSSNHGLSSRIAKLQEEVAAAAARSGRQLDAVTVVAVSKTVDRTAIDAAYAAGIRHFGENRVQVAQAKFGDSLPADATLHLIGQLQTNKAATAAKLFGQIDSVDRASLIVELQKQAAKLERSVPVLLQVNVAREEQKAGCEVAEAAELLAAIVESPNLQLMGLMTIAPLVAAAEAVRPVFRGLRELRDRLRESHPEWNLSELSMGMSNDFGVAIEEGATQVRVGRALFGD